MSTHARQWEDEAFCRGLRELVDATFPRTCPCCGEVYADLRDYVARTQGMSNGRASLKQSMDEDGAVIVDLFRNCHCGSTLMDSFHDRRDASPAGQARRERFIALLEHLVRAGVDERTARAELQTLMRGGHSELLQLRFRAVAEQLVAPLSKND